MKALGCLVLLAVLAAFSHTTHASDGMCRWEGGPGTDASCKAEDCPSDGGDAQCTQVQIKKPTAGKNPQGYVYDMCDGLNYVSNDRRWCEAAGGVWGSDPYGQGACFDYPEHVIGGDGTTVDAESLLQSIPDKKIGNPTCDKLNVDDSGWGKGSTTDDLCWAITPIAINGINVTDRRERTYSGHVKASDGSCSEPWSTTIVEARWREVECPVGYARRDRPDHNVDCVRPQTCCSVRGDPVDMATGARIESSTDYRFKGAGGLELTRHYMSFGFFRPRSVASTDVASGRDYWRTNYDDRVYPAPSGAGYLADLSLANGTVRTFALDGGTTDDRLGPRHETLVKDSSGQWIYTATSGAKKVFDAGGRLSAIVSPEGLQTLVQFDASGHLGLVQDPFGRTLAFSYVGDELTQVVLPDSRVVTYGYDDAERLTSVQRPDGTTLAYEYSVVQYPNLLTAQVDEMGRRTEFGYDSNGRATSTNRKVDGLSETFAYGNLTARYTSFAGHNQTLAFSPAGSLLKASQEAGNCPVCKGGTVSRQFDVAGRLVAESNGLGVSTRRHYAAGSMLEESRDIGVSPDGDTSSARHVATQWEASSGLPNRFDYSASGAASNTIALAYSEVGKVTSYIRSSGGFQSGFKMAYDDLGRVSTISTNGAPENAGTKIAYFDAGDACVGCRGQPKAVSTDIGQMTSFSDYDANGNPTRVTESNGLSSSLSYDASGNVQALTLGVETDNPETAKFEYDAAGRVTSTTRPDGVKVSYRYDDVKHTMTQSLPSGQSITHYFDADGAELGHESRDAAGALRDSVRRTLDNNGRVIAQTDGAGNTWQYQYDDSNALMASLSPSGRVKRFEYDAFGQVVKEIDSDGASILYEHDGLGNLTKITDPRGVSTSYVYDGLGRMVSTQSPDSGNATYAYDTQGRLASATDGAGNHKVLTYDALSRVVKANYSSSDGASSFEVLTTYDTAPHGIGRIASVLRGQINVAFEYDAFGRVVKETTTNGSDSTSTAYQYESGHLSRMTYPDGMVADFTYDQDGRVARVRLDGATVADDIAYAPSGALEAYTSQSGLRIERARDITGRVSSTLLIPEEGSGHRWSYDYDLAGRLTVAQDDEWSIGFSYDSNGNRTSATTNGETRKYAYQASTNRLVTFDGPSAGQSLISYDANGSAVSVGGLALAYGPDGILNSVNGTSFVYDGLGRRVQKLGPDGDVRFAYDASGNLLSEDTGNDASSYQVVRIGETPIALAYKSRGTRVFFAVHLDQVDRVEQLSDAAGVVRWQRGSEDPFGRVLSPPIANGVIFDGLFPGQLKNANDDLVANDARHFLPSTGRYLQVDPVGLRGGINPYAYVGSDPLNATDPDGREKQSLLGPHASVDPGEGSAMGYSNGTVVCDGMGGLTIYIPPGGALHSDCVSDCVLLHELTHMRDMLSVERARGTAACAGQPYLTLVLISPRSDSYLSEIHAYQAELACLQAKLAAMSDCDKCRTEVQNLLDFHEDILKRYEYAYKNAGPD